MTKVLVGCTQELKPGPDATALLEVLRVAASAHNRGLYALRRVHFSNRERRRAGGSVTYLREPRAPELSALVRGKGTWDVNREELVVQGSGNQSWASGAVGGVIDRVVYDLHASWKSFVAARAKHFKAGGGVEGLPQPPTYARGYLALAWRAQLLTLSADGTTVRLARSSSPNRIELPILALPQYVQDHLEDGARLVQVRAVPHRTRAGMRVVLHWTLEVIAPDAPTTATDALESGPVAGLDLGVENLLALSVVDLRAQASSPLAASPFSSNPAPPGPAPLLVRGASLLDECAKVTSKEREIRKMLPFTRGGKAVARPRQVRSSHALRELRSLSGRRKHHLVHASVQPVLDQLVQTGARMLVVGANPQMKTGMSMSTRQNRRFGAIPHLALRQALRHGCALRGILYLEVEESYTSRTSFGDGELPVRQKAYAGRRVRRGLLVTGTGVRINADVNASLQILTKVLIKEGLTGVLTPEVRTRVFKASLNPRAVVPVRQ